METILEVEHLKKYYRQHCAVNDVSFTVNKGEILCLLGPNGAGKTTIMHMISALLKPNDGVIKFKNEDIQINRKAFQKQLGFVPQSIALYEALTARKNLTFFAGLYGLKGEALRTCVEDGLVFAGLMERGDDCVASFSTGMKRRLNIAAGILHHPDVVIMDEPTVGIDPQSRNHILESIQQLSKKGMTILYTTHYMEEVEEISDRIIIMDHGQVIAQGNKESLKEALDVQRAFIFSIEHPQFVQIDDFYTIEGVQQVALTNDTLSIHSLKSVENLDHIIQVAMKQRLMIQNLHVQTTTLETVFLNLTGRSLRD